MSEQATLTINAQSRKGTGSRIARALRKAGQLPGILYDSKGLSSPIQLDRHALEMMVRRHGGHNMILDLVLDGAPAKKVFLKEIQNDCLRDSAIHVDLMEISLTRKIHLAVPIHLVGEPVGVTMQGGVLEHLLREVEIECLPMDIIREFAVDVSKLSVGDSIAVRDIAVDPKLTVLTAPNITIASVLMPKLEEEAKPEEGAEAAATEGAEAAATEGAEGKPAAAPEPAAKAKEPQKAKGKE